jgi:hypothetical protein
MSPRPAAPKGARTAVRSTEVPMSDELEAAGAAVTAGLVAAAVDGPTAKPAASLDPHASCRNCGKSLSGPYCAGCGQAAHIHRSLLHFGEEVLHGILHFDAKAWRTVLLLVARPGLLTRRYIDGQRTRYVSPLALFLFTMFLMYFVFSLTGGVTATPAQLGDADRAAARSELSAAIDEARAEVAQHEAALARAREQGAGVADAEGDVIAARKALQVVQAALAAFDKAAAIPATGAATGVVEAVGDEASRIETGNAALDEAIRQQLKNPELAWYRLKNTAYKFSFLLIPISLPFLWLMFALRRDIAMYDHAVFCLYSLSFMSLLFASVALLSLTPLDASLALITLVVPPLHMFVHLRETYGLRTRSALWRTLALLVVAATAFVVFIVLVAVVGLR